MPSTNNEARLQLLELLKSQERTAAWLSRKVGENRMWVSNRLNGNVGLQIDDYSKMLAVLAPEQLTLGK